MNRCFFILFFFFLSIHCEYTLNFTLGSSDNPPIGRELVPLYFLQSNTSYSQTFIKQYNILGLTGGNSSMDYCCIRVVEGILFLNEDSIIPFVNGRRECSVNTPYIVQLGAGNQYFTFLSLPLLQAWQARTNDSCYYEKTYSLYGPLYFTPSLTSSPTSAPSQSISTSPGSSYFQLGSLNNPVEGKYLVSLYDLHYNPSYANIFINQYNNNNGIAVKSVKIDYCCIRVQEGAIYYYPNGTNSLLVTYKDSRSECNSYASGFLQFGYYGRYPSYYNTLDTSIISTWSADYTTSCSNENTYALYGPSVPTYTPIVSPSRSIYNSNYFIIGSLLQQPAGKQLVSLYNLQNNEEYASLFMYQYNNNNGINIESIYVNYCCILVEEGALYYEPSGNTVNLYTYKDGNLDCVNFIQGYIQLGIGETNNIYNTISLSDINTWNADYSQPCSTANTYALFGPLIKNSISPSKSMTMSN